MKNRIEKILREEKIASSKFADEIGIQRSSMSHILSGRNNPSLDIIQRILRKFPHINSDWLVLGVGNMYDNSVSNLSLFKDDELKEEQAKSKSIDNNDEFLSNSTEIAYDKVKEEPQAEYKTKSTTNRTIKKIMVFYNDGSFEEIINS